MARSGRLITYSLLLVTVVAAAAASAQIVINEIEYDQSGNDLAEFIELFEPARTGMSLAGWQLILYNGQSSVRGPYLTIELSGAPGGVMPLDGYLVIGSAPAVANVDINIDAPDTGWIQNGAPDGMALVQNGVVIELLAYEGEFEANTNGTGGPAAGMLFPDIGVDEVAGDGIGLQRIPNGGTWTEVPEAQATPGRRNPNGPALVPVGKLVLMQLSDADSGPIALCASGGVPPLTFVITALPVHGELSDDFGPILGTPAPVTGELRFAPEPGFSGLDAFDFRVRDAVMTVSNPVTQEVAVQAGDVVICEVMYIPALDWRGYSYVEIHNRGATIAQLGRLDASRSNSIETTGNLAAAIPPGQTRIIAPDATAIGYDPEDFRCNWDLREEDIIRVPVANFETMSSAANNADCAASEGSRVLLFDSAGNLQDAVDLGLVGMPSGVAGQSLTIHDAFLPPPGTLTARTNDDPGAWFNAGSAGVPGVRLSHENEQGGPMIVPGISDNYVPGDCSGRCCFPGGSCQVLREDDCSAGFGAWVAAARCEIDSEDVSPFVGCLSGPVAAMSPGCAAWDFDVTGRVDARDFAAFQSAFSDAPCP